MTIQQRKPRLIANLHDAASCEEIAVHEVSSACWDSSAANGKGAWDLSKAWNEVHNTTGLALGSRSYWIELTQE